MSGARLCPYCGNILHAERALSSVPVGRYLFRELLFWIALAVLLAFLWVASSTGERVAGVGAIVLLVWLLRWSRGRAMRRGSSESDRYRCAYCHQWFEGEDLRELPAR